MMIRSFIALELPEPVIGRLVSAEHELELAPGKINWEGKDKLHVTLKFIGDITENNLIKLSHLLEILVLRFNTFELSLDQLGYFKSNGIPRILWAGLKENGNLTKLAGEIDILCSEFGFEREKRKFKPHITLLRIKNEDIINNLKPVGEIDFDQLKFETGKVTLFQSILSKNGSIYKPIKSFLTKK
ncbi:MAG TPA: RNA 2',3'-cyclic phosphodiesterase [Melioribacteraceae bacterium]|nr:RNA 2',3'-cyclic phosphodiesterase [Melioribacteraceae bacterium]